MADSLEQVIRSYLTADATFLSKFDNLYWLEAPTDAAYPYLVYWQVDDPGDKRVVNKDYQGMARIQIDIWDSSKFRGVRLREDVKEKMESLNETRDVYTMTTMGTNEQTIPRESAEEPFHFVVDTIIRWSK